LGQSRSCAHIIDLIGVAWEQDESAQLSPVLALEYAQHNSLTRFLADNQVTALTWPEKKALVSDVTQGVHYVHELNFVWGDCKPENVLICQSHDDPTSFTAKISDFGLSVGGSSDVARFSGFSLPWISPEAKDAVGMSALRQSEIYSLGLVVWTILLDGQPFQLSNWCTERPFATDENGSVQSTEITALTASGELQDIATTSFRAASISRISDLEVQIFSDVLRCCLATQPAIRPSAKAMIQLLHPNNHQVISITRPSQETKSCRIDMEWLMATFGPKTGLHAVGTEIFKQLSRVVNNTTSKHWTYQLGLFRATGFGCERNVHASVELMLRSASTGHELADQVLPQLKALAEHLPNLSHDNTLISAPLIDLEDDFGLFQDIVSSDAQRNPQLSGKISAQTPIAQHEGKGKGKSTATYTLHDAVSTGDLENLQLLLKQPTTDINERNSEGNTALFCAAMQNQHEAFECLLQNGPDLKMKGPSGQTILHVLATVNDQSLKFILAVLDNGGHRKDLALSAVIDAVATGMAENIDGSRTSPGTPLEWAVEHHNQLAVKYLLDLGSDPSFSASGSSALHRAASRHDCAILALLLKGLHTEALMRYDKQGRTILACVIQRVNAFDRLIVGKNGDDATKQVIELILAQGHALPRLEIVLENGESAVYHAVKSECLQFLPSSWIQKWEEMGLSAALSSSGPNRWSTFRRALYCSDSSTFERLCSAIAPEWIEQLLKDKSPDGLGILHELAFLPPELAKSIYSTLAATAKKHKIRLSHSPLRPRGNRPRMTPFQLAVVCGNTELADLYIARNWNATNPLYGLEKSRFLAFVISYPCQDPDTLSTWLSHIVDDDVVKSMRKFPLPMSIGESLRYLLAHEEEWWKTAREDSKSSGTMRHGPDFDNDANADPFLAWKPTFLTALEFDAQGAQDPAVELYGVGSIVDYSILGFGHRLRHILDYGSFLLCSNPDTQDQVLRGHPYVTALELGLHVVLTSPYKSQAMQNFNVLLNHFQGPTYCNFPYYQYLPTGRTRFIHLRRRKTILHVAIQNKHVEAVSSLISGGADIQMANNEWQTPLHVARLVEHNKAPEARGNSGTFLGRVGISNLPAVAVPADEEDPPEKQIRSLLERKTLEFSAKPGLRFRALREVKWPWDDYETDDLGLRFVLFYLTTLVLAVGTVMLLLRLLLFAPYILYGLTSALGDAVDVLEDLAVCFLDSLHNGSDPHALCVVGRYDFAPIDLRTIIPALEHHLSTIITIFDECYDNSTNFTAIPERTDPDDKDFLPGCDQDDLEDPRLDQSGSELNAVVYHVLQDECQCRCSWFGKPKMRGPLK
jgi:ankyrin repeat protein